MIKKGFSLIETIFVLVLISLIASVAVSKFGSAIDNTHLTKIKSDILQIRAGITQYKNKMILRNESQTLDTLDENTEILFSKILNPPIISSNIQEALSWHKVSNTTYKVYLNTTDFIEFIYDDEKATFDCDISSSFCKELQL